MKTAGRILCRAEKTSAVHALPDYSCMRCPGCRLVSLHPMPGRAAFLEIYSGVDRRSVFPSTGPTGQEGVVFERFEEELDRIERHAPRGCILGVVSAGGFFLYGHRERGWAAWCVDIACVESKYARRRFGMPIITGTLADARFASGSFDVVTLWHPPDYLPEPVSELGEIWRILKPGGLLVISVSTAHSLKDFDYGPIPLHGWRFKRTTLSALAEKKRFRVIRIAGAGGTSAVRTLKRIGMRNPVQTLVRHYRFLSLVSKTARATFNMAGPQLKISLYARELEPVRGT